MERTRKSNDPDFNSPTDRDHQFPFGPVSEPPTRKMPKEQNADALPVFDREDRRIAREARHYDRDTWESYPAHSNFF